MIRYHVGAGAARVRWSLSPVHEAVSLALLLTEPQRHPVHQEWVRRRRTRLDALDVSALTVFMADGAYRPDFLDPTPLGGEPSFDDGLALLLGTPDDRVRAELVDATRHLPAATADELLADPRRTLERTARAVATVWRAVLEPEWSSLRQALRAEVLDRALQVTRDGLDRVVPRLHPSMDFRDGVLSVDRPVDLEVMVEHREGLVLVPSLFITDRVQCSTSEYWSPAVYYPAAGRYLWSAPPPTRSLQRLLGATRAQILTALAATPLQTGVVARLVNVTMPTASEHLAVLREAGLVDRTRVGRTATHEVTTAGRALLRASGA